MTTELIANIRNEILDTAAKTKLYGSMKNDFIAESKTLTKMINSLLEIEGFDSIEEFEQTVTDIDIEVSNHRNALYHLIAARQTSYDLIDKYTALEKAGESNLKQLQAYVDMFE